jgi:hypothetical protein
MRVNSMLTVGFLSIMAATTLVNASDSFAVEARDARRVDVIGTLHETVAQWDSVQGGGQWMRVDVIDSIGSEGPGYAYPKSMRVDVIDSIKSGGPVYSYNQPMSH